MTFTNSGNSNFKNNILYLAFALIFFICACYLQNQYPMPLIKTEKQNTVLNIKNFTLKFFSIGNKRLISSILWIKTLLESDTEHYKQKDLNNWMYLRFLSISELQPKFYENYLYGGMFLSIVKDDLVGAADIYERGIKVYPDDYKLNYNAGFNYYYEMGNNKKSLYFLNKIKSHKEAPPYISTIISKIQHEISPNNEETIKFLELQLSTTKDEFIKYKIINHIYDLKAEIDLECLNQKKEGCNYFDYFGNKYLLKQNLWTSLKPRSEFKINKKPR